MTLQQLESAFLSFRPWITEKVKDLEQKILELTTCCKCKSNMYINYHNIYFYVDGGQPDLTQLHSIFNDLFPLDDICSDEKAILIVNDATLYMRYAYTYDFNDTNSGWQLIEAAKGGKFQ